MGRLTVEESRMETVAEHTGTDRYVDGIYRDTSGTYRTQLATSSGCNIMRIVVEWQTAAATMLSGMKHAQIHNPWENARG
jgi:hypothetical protein